MPFSCVCVCVCAHAYVICYCKLNTTMAHSSVGPGLSRNLTLGHTKAVCVCERLRVLPSLWAPCDRLNKYMRAHSAGDFWFAHWALPLGITRRASVRVRTRSDMDEPNQPVCQSRRRRHRHRTSAHLLPPHLNIVYIKLPASTCAIRIRHQRQREPTRSHAVRSACRKWARCANVWAPWAEVIINHAGVPISLEQREWGGHQRLMGANHRAVFFCVQSFRRWVLSACRPQVVLGQHYLFVPHLAECRLAEWSAIWIVVWLLQIKILQFQICSDHLFWNIRQMCSVRDCRLYTFSM